MNMFAFFMPGPPEMVIILILGVLLFGKRLPEVGKNIGQGLLEFKRGIGEYKEEAGANAAESKRAVVCDAEDDEQSAGTKFEPPEA